MVTVLAAASAVVLPLATASMPGCGSTCASNCPEVLFYAVATSGETLDIADVKWSGAACPPSQAPSCVANSNGTMTCSAVALVGLQEGPCQLDLTFNDGRAPFSVT